METQLLLVTAYFGTIFALVVGFLVFRSRTLSSGNNVDENEQATAGAAGGRARRQRGMQRMRAQAQRGEEPDQGDEDDAGRPANRREERREERQAQREADEERAAAKKEKAAKYEERLQARQQEREEKEAEQERIRREKAEAELKQVEEEYQQWKELISVEDVGSAENNVDDEGLLQRFVKAIHQQKVVPLEDLAVEFGLPSAEAVLDRIKDLEEKGLISGIIDDRGKYICITSEEMQAVVDFINQRGRVSIAEVVAQSNRLIDLTTGDDKTPEVSFDFEDDAVAEQATVISA